ncbi:MAG: hypothetical protein ABIJ59_13265 [Pseudomonadota bacterium]
MSLTLALKGKNCVVLAADSRITKGYTLEGPKTKDDSIKFVKINNYFGAMTYGLSDIGNRGIAALKEKISGSSSPAISYKDILKAGLDIFVAKNIDWSQKNPQIPRKERDVGFIIGGYDEDEKEFQIFNLESPEFKAKKLLSGCLLAGQWHVAKFFTNLLFKPDLPNNILIDLVVLLLNETMTVEKTVGGEINLAIITQSKGFEWISKDKINTHIKNNLKIKNQIKHLYNTGISDSKDMGLRQ